MHVDIHVVDGALDPAVETHPDLLARAHVAKFQDQLVVIRPGVLVRRHELEWRMVRNHAVKVSKVFPEMELDIERACF